MAQGSVVLETGRSQSLVPALRKVFVLDCLVANGGEARESRSRKRAARALFLMRASVIRILLLVLFVVLEMRFPAL